MRNRKRGITKAELITTVVVLTLLVGLLIPWIFRKRGISQRNFCELRQIVVSKGIFLASNETNFFPGYRQNQVGNASAESVETSWVFPVLPFIHPSGGELAEVFRNRSVMELSKDPEWPRFANGPYRNFFEDYGKSGNRAGQKIPIYIPELVCPESDRRPTEKQPQPMSFIANCGMPDVKNSDGPLDHLSNGVFFDTVDGSQFMTLDFLLSHDGLENTFLITENLNGGQAFDTEEKRIGFVWINSYVDQVADRNDKLLLGINQLSDTAKSYQLARPSSYHPGGVNVAFADGSTTFLSDKIDYLAYVQYMTANGFEVKIAGTDEYAKDPYRLQR